MTVYRFVVEFAAYGRLHRDEYDYAADTDTAAEQWAAEVFDTTPIRYYVRRGQLRHGTTVVAEYQAKAAER